MSNAIWLSLSLPKWYFQTILTPFAVGPLTMIPAAGVVALAIAVVMSSVRRRRESLWFFATAAASQLLVAIAGLLRGKVEDEASNPLLLGFLLAQLVFCGWRIWRSDKARVEALLLSLFTLTYALFAAFIAAMSFSDTWL
jgi:hypothetical protein